MRLFQAPNGETLGAINEIQVGVFTAAGWIEIEVPVEGIEEAIVDTEEEIAAKEAVLHGVTEVDPAAEVAMFELVEIPHTIKTVVPETVIEEVTVTPEVTPEIGEVVPEEATLTTENEGKKLPANRSKNKA